MERFADREFRKHIPPSMRETWSTLRKVRPQDHTGQDLPPWWPVANDLWLQDEGLTPLELDWLGPGEGQRHEDAQQRPQAALMKSMIYEGEVRIMDFMINTSMSCAMNLARTTNTRRTIKMRGTMKGKTCLTITMGAMDTMQDAILFTSAITMVHTCTLKILGGMRFAHDLGTEKALHF